MPFRTQEECLEYLDYTQGTEMSKESKKKNIPKKSNLSILSS